MSDKKKLADLIDEAKLNVQEGELQFAISFLRLALDKATQLHADEDSAKTVALNEEEKSELQWIAKRMAVSLGGWGDVSDGIVDPLVEKGMIIKIKIGDQEYAKLTDDGIRMLS